MDGGRGPEGIDVVDMVDRLASTGGPWGGRTIEAYGGVGSKFKSYF